MKTWTKDTPTEHWPSSCVNVKDKIVLDLGCGNFSHSSNQGYSTTSEHWLSLGAKKVIGLDAVKNDIEFLMKKVGSNPDRSVFVVEEVKSPDQINKIIKSFNVEVVKADIEGMEAVLFDIPDDDFSRVKEYYIETHSQNLFDRAMNKFRQCRYDIREVMQYEPNKVEIIRVIFAFRN